MNVIHLARIYFLTIILRWKVLKHQGGSLKMKKISRHMKKSTNEYENSRNHHQYSIKLVTQNNNFEQRIVFLQILLIYIQVFDPFT